MKTADNIVGIDFRGEIRMKINRNSNKSWTAIIAGCLIIGSVIIWKIREWKLNQEIDEFDQNMHELKRKKSNTMITIKKEACERKEVTKCCQIR